MRRRVIKLSLMLLAMALAAPTMAQEGHPLKGSWIGVWESNSEHGDDILVILNWDGERVGGIINPGTDNIEIDSVTLDPDGWKVRIEAGAEGRQGGALHYVIEGAIEDLELPNRYIAGTWQSQSGSGKFEIRRQ